MIENILKKYPKILDSRFLILYLCSVNQLIVDTSPATKTISRNVARHVPTTNTNTNALLIFNSQFLIQEKHGKKRNLFRIPSYQPS